MEYNKKKKREIIFPFQKKRERVKEREREYF